MCEECIGNSLRNVWDMNDRIYDSALVTEHDIAVTAVNPSHVKFLLSLSSVQSNSVKTLAPQLQVEL